MPVASLLPSFGTAPPDRDAASAAIRLELDVRLALAGVAELRAGFLVRTAAARYRAALADGTTIAWQRFADAILAVLRAAGGAPPDVGSPQARGARRRLDGFLSENPDLGRNRSVPRPSYSSEW